MILLATWRLGELTLLIVLLERAKLGPILLEHQALICPDRQLRTCSRQRKSSSRLLGSLIAPKVKRPAVDQHRRAPSSPSSNVEYRHGRVARQDGLQRQRRASHYRDRIKMMCMYECGLTYRAVIGRRIQSDCNKVVSTQSALATPALVRPNQRIYSSLRCCSQAGHCLLCEKLTLAQGTEHQHFRRWFPRDHPVEAQRGEGKWMYRRICL